MMPTRPVLLSEQGAYATAKDSDGNLSSWYLKRMTGNSSMPKSVD